MERWLVVSFSCVDYSRSGPGSKPPWPPVSKVTLVQNPIALHSLGENGALLLVRFFDARFIFCLCLFCASLNLCFCFVFFERILATLVRVFFLLHTVPVVRVEFEFFAERRHIIRKVLNLFGVGRLLV